MSQEKVILVVDDSYTVRDMASVVLSDAGYKVITAVDGVDGLKKLAQQRVHLIISDVNMPNMDGIDMVAEIRHQPLYKFTPILMLTTENGEHVKGAGRSVGATAWLVKPCGPERMRSAVQKLLI